MTTFDHKLDAPAKSRMRGRVREVSLPMLAAPDPHGYAEHATADGRRVFVADAVIDALTRLECQEHPNETAGLLFGRHFTDGHNRCTLVTNLITPEPGEVEGTPTSVTITANGVRQMRSRARRSLPCADPVGWGHTHPTFAPFFSGTDRAEQRLWTEPTSVGIVLSGIRDGNDLYHVYVGPESTLATALPHRKTREIVEQPVEAPIASRSDGDGPSWRSSRPRRVLIYRVVATGAAAGILLISAASWRTATSARDAADRADARSAAVSQVATLAGKRTHSGQQIAAHALGVATAASRTAAMTRQTTVTQLNTLGAQTAEAGKAADIALAAAEHALQQNRVGASALASIKAELDALQAAIAKSAQIAAKTKPQPQTKSSAPSSAAGKRGPR